MLGSRTNVCSLIKFYSIYFFVRVLLSRNVLIEIVLVYF
jgi:hypothetical protein